MHCFAPDPSPWFASQTGILPPQWKDVHRAKGRAVTEQWSEAHLRLAVKAACVALWSWNVDDDAFHMDERGYELWDVPYAQSVRFEDLSANIHPADRNRVRAAFQATRSADGSYEIDFRIIVHDEIRWVSARGQGADAGIINRTMFGVFLDVTGRKQAEEGSEFHLARLCESRFRRNPRLNASPERRL